MHALLLIIGCLLLPLSIHFAVGGHTLAAGICTVLAVIFIMWASDSPRRHWYD